MCLESEVTIDLQSLIPFAINDKDSLIDSHDVERINNCLSVPMSTARLFSGLIFKRVSAKRAWRARFLGTLHVRCLVETNDKSLCHQWNYVCNLQKFTSEFILRSIQRKKERPQNRILRYPLRQPRAVSYIKTDK